MIWVTWRQHRRSLIASLSVFAGADLALLVTGTRAATLIAALPLVAGAFCGAPVIAADLESGTARFAWTQGYERTRLVVAKLGMIAGILAGGAASLGLIAAWRLGGLRLYLSAPALIGWTVCAFALAALLGLVYRSVPPAVGGTILLTLTADIVLYHHPLFAAHPFIEGGLVLAAAAAFAGAALLFVRRPRIGRLGPASVAEPLPAVAGLAVSGLAVSGLAASGVTARRRWPAMARITWRQHRLGLGVMAALAAVIAFFQVKYWLKASDAYHVVSTPGCRSQPERCFDSWVHLGQYPQLGLTVALLAFAGLIAMEFGPTIGREFQWGTDRLLWTQGAGRLGWTAGRMAALTAFVLGIGLPVALLAGPSIAPFERAGFVSRWTVSEFLTSAPVYLALLACALAVAMLLGAAIKRTLGSMFAIFASFVLCVVVPPNLYGPLLSIGAKVGPGAPVDPHDLMTMSRPHPNPAGVGPPGSWVLHGWYVTGHGARLARQHLRYLVSYQPADRYWLFQCIAAACLLAVAGLAWAATLWIVKASSR